MNKVDWKTKLSSRKFWALLAGFITALLVIFKVNEASIAQITAIIGAFGSIVIYMISEAYVDGKAAEAEVVALRILQNFTDFEEEVEEAK